MKTAPPQVHLPLGPAAQLATLRRLDESRSWTTIDDIRHCLGCGRQFSAQEIQIFFFADSSPSLRAHCPTPGCEAPLSDWVWPRESVLIPGAQERALQSPSHFFPKDRSMRVRRERHGPDGGRGGAGPPPGRFQRTLTSI